MSFLARLSRLDGLDLQSFGPLQRLMLVCDGTLTDTLQVALEEPIGLVKLPPAAHESLAPVADLSLDASERTMWRRILLVGQRTRKTYVYAETCLAIDRLPRKFCDDLLNSVQPLGRLWADHRLETYKELLRVYRVSDPAWGAHFDPAEHNRLLARTYRVFSAGWPVMLITECFPETFVPAVPQP